MDKQKINGLDILNFHPAHVELAYLTPHEEKNFSRLPGAFQTLIELNRKSAQAVTIMQDGKILMMCGFINLWPGTAELWLIPTTYALDCPIVFSKSVKNMIELMAESLRLHRMQATVIDDDSHSNFMDFLGFEKEGLLKQYSDAKENYIPWARIFERTA